MENEHFFNIASTFYDDMISFEKSAENKLKFYDLLLDKSKTKVADVGCGTGIDSICLSKLGFNVTAFDISEEMINKAKANALKNEVNVNFCNINLAEIIDLEDNFDYIISMGNTIANIPSHRISLFFNNVRSLLKKDGQFIFQIVNYNKILKEKNRILGVTEDADKIYIRFYDFLNLHMNFNILTIHKNNLKENSLITTTLYPYTHKYLSELLITSGLKEVKHFSGLNKSITNFFKSEDIIYTVCRII
ncbi:MAG TPA: class I SAM-dependent methyltransferase [Melioribacteraceae bacterium]|nr:class I SAM-dependent methyltransferase [Melioribacteraceae bacterium]